MAVRYTNLPNTDLSVEQSQEDKTRTFFDGYFEQSVTITGAEWDVVYAFSLNKTGNEDQATSLSEAIIASADAQEVNTTDVINELKKYDSLHLDQVLALYFNETRRGTSLLGYSNPIVPNKYVSRNIDA